MSIQCTGSRTIKHVLKTFSKISSYFQIQATVLRGAYTDKNSFVGDFSLLYRNCAAYNGKNDALTKDALALLDGVKAALKQYKDKLL